jgi:hypothetical protein
MIGKIDGFYVAAQIRLVRQVHKGAILLLEGDRDARVFGRFIDKGFCDIEVGFGKKNVIEALDLLEDEGFQGIAAIIDSDFDRLRETTYRLENLCITDSHDLDLTIFASLALDRYLAEHADDQLFKSQFNSDVNRVRDRILTASLPLAYCRFTSACRAMDLYFKDLRHEQFINVDDLSVDFDTLASNLISRSSTTCTTIDLRRYVALEAAKALDPYQLANGHDVAAILGIALRKIIGRRRTIHTWATEVEMGLRLAFDWEALVDTALYQCLRRWESENKPYRIFRQVVA